MPREPRDREQEYDEAVQVLDRWRDVDALYSEDALNEDFGVLMERRSDDYELRMPDPGWVKVTDAHGKVTHRPMNQQELAAWRQAEEAEDG